MIEVRRIRRQSRGEWLGVRVEVDEHEAQPLLNRQRRQREVLLVEAIRAFHGRCPEEAAGEVVAPQVIRACELGAVTAVVGHLHAPVLAHRGERMDRTVLGARDDHRLVVDDRGEVVADVGDAARPSDAQPLSGEDRLTLERQELLRGIDLGRHRTCTGEIGDRGIEGCEELGGEESHGVKTFVVEGLVRLRGAVSAFGSRSRNLRILPTLVRGSSSTKVMSRGRFAFVRRSTHHA